MLGHEKIWEYGANIEFFKIYWSSQLIYKIQPLGPTFRFGQNQNNNTDTGPSKLPSKTKFR
jgi:hypothetical protein